MKGSHVYYHPQFRRSFLNLPDDIQRAAEIKIVLFRNDPFSGALKTHKLYGKLKNHWSFTVSPSRANIELFLFLKKQM